MDFNTKLALLKTSFFEDYIPQPVDARNQLDASAGSPAMDVIGRALGYRPQEDVALGTMAGGAGVGLGSLAILRRQKQQEQALMQVLEAASQNKGILSRLRPLV